MIAYKLAAALFAEIILFPLVLFPVSGYVRAVAMGALDFYDDLHDPIVFICAPVVITPLSYFLDHHQLFNPEKAEKNHIFIILSHNMYNLLDIF
jgi:hypothetical protein